MSVALPKPSRHDLHFKLWDIPVRVSPWFWLTQAAISMVFTGLYLLVTLDQYGLRALPVALMIPPTWMACAFVSILLHELGHVVVGRCYGAPGEIVLTGLGGLALGSAEVHERWQRVLVHLAGPAAQLLLAAGLWVVAREWEPSHVFLLGPRQVLVFGLVYLRLVNTVWPIFNLIPVEPLDGARVLQETLQWNRPEAAPWERPADWWKGGKHSFDWRPSRDPAPSLFRWLFPLAALGIAAAFVIWLARDSDKPRLQHEAFAKLRQRDADADWDGSGIYTALNLRGCHVGDEEMALVEVFNDDHFVRLDVSRTRITDAGLHHLSVLTGLRRLSLEDTRIGDAGLRHLAGLVRLEELSLAGTRVTDAGLGHLEGMQSLESLSLSRTAVTDAGIASLMRLTSLKTLDLTETHVTADGVAELRRALPALRIHATDDAKDE
jgi:Zn-dependent protease